MSAAAFDLEQSSCGFIFPPHPMVDAERHALFNRLEWHRLSPLEWALFECLARRGGRLCTKKYIFESLYSDRADGGPISGVINVITTRLRQKCPFPIETVYGSGLILNGYALVKDHSVPSAIGAPPLSRLMAGR